MHKCDYQDRIVIQNNKLVRIVKAICSNKSYQNQMDVYKHTEQNKHYCRNVVSNYYNMYGVIFGEEDYYGSRMGIEPYSSVRCGHELPLWCMNRTSNEDKETVLSVYPEFKDLISNFCTNSTLIKAIYFWNKDRELFSSLVKHNLEYIALNESVYKLSQDKKDEIISYITDNFIGMGISLKQLQQIVKLSKLLPDVSSQSLIAFVTNDMNVKSYIRILNKLDAFKNFSKSMKKEVTDYMINSNVKFSLNRIKNYEKCLKKYPAIVFEHLQLMTDFGNTPSKFKYVIDMYEKGFKYVMKKFSFKDISSFKTALDIYGNYPKEEEILLSLGLSNLGLDTYYYQKDEDIKKRCRSFIKENLDFCVKNNINYRELDFLIKNNYSKNNNLQKILDIFSYDYNYAEDKKTLDYILNKNIDVRDYDHYLNRVKKCNHDEKNEYWRFPNNLEKAIEKVEKEYREIIALEDMKLQNEYFNAVQKYIENNPQVTIDGYEVFIPENIADIREQAEFLHQCLMTMNYPKKVIEDKSILVFLHKDGKPFATCEVSKEKVIKQFYRDEKDRSNCLATNEDKKIMNKWLEKAKLVA